LQGATELALRSTANLQELRQQVTSKGGTTYAAITTMQAEKMPEAIHKGVDAAYLRAKELGQELA
jgi:pyrroline-5-carboxylate reductase